MKKKRNRHLPTPNREQSMDIIIPYEEIAQRLGITVKTARKAVRNGQFPSIMVGKRRKALRKPFEDMVDPGDG